MFAQSFVGNLHRSLFWEKSKGNFHLPWSKGEKIRPLTFDIMHKKHANAPWIRGIKVNTVYSEQAQNKALWKNDES